MARTLEQIDAELDNLRALRAGGLSHTRVGDVDVTLAPDLDGRIGALERERGRLAGSGAGAIRGLRVIAEKGL